MKSGVITQFMTELNGYECLLKLHFDTIIANTEPASTQHTQPLKVADKYYIFSNQTFKIND